MRYFILIFAMLGDIALIAASSYVIYSLPMNLFGWLIVVMTFHTWQKQGGFIAWSPKGIKAFLENAKKMGL